MHARPEFEVHRVRTHQVCPVDTDRLRALENQRLAALPRIGAAVGAQTLGPKNAGRDIGTGPVLPCQGHQGTGLNLDTGRDLHRPQPTCAGLSTGPDRCRRPEATLPSPTMAGTTDERRLHPSLPCWTITKPPVPRLVPSDGSEGNPPT